ncbi:response regulator receiver modulated diguanylate cyclase/phosphodiesterase with PAS/PAC sensor(s) [Desulfonatronospira thiodismutans ASO3-1]|uniref:Response regulator receiver modulated diguanylate cyclase/phosphodiesterase with PAS/PAC sensor(S) n=2 Tax=Desulfonatronovibrionaceae TaxID=3031459 RepID=D6SUE5_9BACT|nr:response regulator receiver modulated diguanylate cyclase/phosphodiesterase with PAS/PAC sensor(s) [Desulfonatronospira thiodismutans ASO3-1]RQD76034.1 MAG: EAL domain-containing protein [Desulfonatronospira sp. MSAO_Bac3]
MSNDDTQMQENTPKILVVDDELINRSMLRKFLASRAEILEAEDGYQALELASSETDLVLLDLMMEGIDGIEVCRRLKERPDTKEVPVIFISAVNDPKVKAQGLEAGGMDFVDKPFDRNELLSRINIHLTLRNQAIEIKKYTQELEELVEKRTRQLQESEKKYRTLFETSKSAMLLVDTESGLLTMANKEFCDLIGYTRQEVENSLHFLNFVHPDDHERARKYFDTSRQDAGTAPAEFEIKGLTREEKKLHLYYKVAAIPEWNSLVISIFDLTDKRRVEEELRQRTFYNSLTGLPNSELFKNRLKKSIQTRQEDQGYFFAVIFIDLDRFKLVNDSLGHQKGDELISLMAKRLERGVKKRDTVAHFGGDDFGLLIEAEDLPEAALRAEKIKDQFVEPFEIAGNEIYTTCSMGIVVSSQDYSEPEEIFRDADTALHRAKSTGPGNYVVFDPQMHAQVSDLLQLETELRKAIQQKEFVLYYQPIYNLADLRITGFEALIRWIHPEKGMVPPNVFIPIAEETELINPLGEWILDTACRQARKWNKGGRELTMNINLSGVQFKDKNLINVLENTFRKNSISPLHINLELTESVVMGDAEESINTLNKIKKLGARLSIDDFGTGYSSLNYLQKFPIDNLKIDRSFINTMETQSGQELVRAILAMTQSLGIKAVAEGIETWEQVKLLQELNCNLGQGYHFSKPLDEESADALLQEHNTDSPAMQEKEPS